MSTYRQLTDKDWEPVEDFDHQCCDCGLVHRVIYRWKNDKLEVRWKRLKGETARERKKKKREKCAVGTGKK